MGVLKEAMADAILTSMWIFSIPFSRILTSIFVSYMGIQLKSFSGLFTSTIVTSLRLLTFNLISRALGGANFNPSTATAFYVAGLKSDVSLISMAARFPAQAAGGVAGVKALLKLMPKEYKGFLRGPSLKVDLHTGAAAEGVLTFVFCFSVLMVVVRGPKSPILKVWSLSYVTTGLYILGSRYSGPSMNPANAFGWAYENNLHNTWEHFFVYWVCSIAGAIVAACFFRVLSPKPVIKSKKKKE
ncbi:aquaporin SIP1-1-like [Humulus lupulus]|uniref:aquaporin SIP1-1-like n=1 Tax=Humulus lupulus TaxID=3486 RepID=UPI002B405F23|nr:aquaporin SIP1-1-like [Humulus lupulus]